MRPNARPAFATHDGNEPIFVLGYQRSGTTLLQSMLGTHRNIAAPPELYFFVRIAALAPYYGDLRDDGNLRRVIKDTIEFPLGTFDSYDLDQDELFLSIADGPRGYGDVLTATMSAVAARQGKRRWSEKSPGQSAGHVLSLVPQARLVHIVRDPRDVVASTLAVPWMTDGARRIAIEVRRHMLDSIAVGTGAGPRRYTMIRYEDLTRDPEAVLRHVCGFIGEEFDPDMLDRTAPASAGTVIDIGRPWQEGIAKPVTSDRQGTWTHRLSRVEKARVAAVVHRELAALGYETSQRRHRLAGAVLNRISQPADVSPLLEQRRFARRFREEGPGVLKERLDEFIRLQGDRLDAPPSST